MEKLLVVWPRLSTFFQRKYREKRIRFNRIDFIEDYDVFVALMDAVQQYGKDMVLSRWQVLWIFWSRQRRFIDSSFEQKNMFVTFYTASYYVTFLNDMVFKRCTWNEYRIKVPEKIPELLTKISQRVMERNQLHLVRVKNKSLNISSLY